MKAIEPPGTESLPGRSQPLARQILTGTGLQVVGRLWSSLCSMGVWMLLGRDLSVGAQGFYTYYFTLFVVAAPILDFGAFGIAVREIARRPDRQIEILRFATAFRFFTGLFCAVTISVIALAREDGAASWMVVLSTIHLLALSPATMGVHFQSRLRFAPIAIPMMAGSSLFLALVYLFHRFGVDRPEPFLIAFGSGIAVQSLLTLLWGMRQVSPFGPWDPALRRELLREMLPIGISATLTALYFQLDAVLLRDLAGDAAVGEYNHAFRLLSFAVLVPITFCQTLFPVLSRMHQKTPERTLLIVQRAVFTMAGVILPAAAMAPFLGDAVIRLVFGSGSEISHRCLSLLAIGGIAIFLGYPQVTALTSIGRQATFTRIVLVVVPVKFSLIWVLHQHHGLVGVACSALIAESCMLTLVTLSLRRYLGSSGLTLGLLRPVMVATLVGAVAFIIRDLSGMTAVLMACVLQGGGMLLAGVIPLRLEVEKEI